MRKWGWVCLRRAMAAQNTSGCRADQDAIQDEVAVDLGVLFRNGIQAGLATLNTSGCRVCTRAGTMRCCARMRATPLSARACVDDMQTVAGPVRIPGPNGTA